MDRVVFTNGTEFSEARGGVHLSDYQITVIKQVWLVIPYLIFVSTLYWYSSRSFLKSAHGVLILLAFVYAVVICEYTEFGPPLKVYVPMYILLLAGLASMTFSLKAFHGKKWVHIIHGLSLSSALLIWFVGSMAIAHDWI